ESSPVCTEAPAMRSGARARANVWPPPHIKPAAVDFSVNSPDPDAFDANTDVDCGFVPEPVRGTTPKFLCAMPDGRHVKVKYGGGNGGGAAAGPHTRAAPGPGRPRDRPDE